MKWEDIKLKEAFNVAEESELQDALTELSLLNTAFETGNFGILIGKGSGILTTTDTFKIQRRLKTIFETNVVIRGTNLRNKRGEDKLNLLGQRLSSNFETVALAAFTGVLIGFAVASGPIGAAIAGLFAAGSAILSRQSNKLSKDLKSASRLLDTVNGFRDLRAGKFRSKERQIKKSLEKRTPEQIKKGIKKDVRTTGIKLSRTFKRNISKLPETIPVRGSDGEVSDYVTARLFDF